MNLIIKDFTLDHIKAVMQLAKQNYEEERGFVLLLKWGLLNRIDSVCH